MFIQRFKSLPVTLEHLEIRHKPVGNKNRLSRLQMGIPGHDNSHVFLGLRYQNFLQSANPFLAFSQSTTEIQNSVNLALVIPRTPRMQATSCRSDEFRQALFDGHVNVFVFCLKGELAGLDFFQNSSEALNNLFPVLLADNALMGKHLGMRNTALNIVLAHACLDMNNRSEFFREFIGRKVKAPSPHFA